MVVMVAVETLERVATASGDRDIEQSAPVGICEPHLAGRSYRVKGEALRLHLPEGCTIITPYDRNTV
jgi:hypothetical protein